jgi:hypothetical protein
MVRNRGHEPLKSDRKPSGLHQLRPTVQARIAACIESGLYIEDDLVIMGESWIQAISAQHQSIKAFLDTRRIKATLERAASSLRSAKMHCVGFSISPSYS